MCVKLSCTRATDMFTLYVAHDRRKPTRHDIGSVLCLKTLEHIPDGIVHTVDCTHQGTRPSFLRGTPTLAHDETGELFTGHNAVHRLHLLALYHAQQFGMSQNNKPTRAVQRAPDVHSPSSHEIAEPMGSTEESLWASSIMDDEVENENTTIGERKLTSDDLSQLSSQRQAMTVAAQSDHPSSQPPPLPPQLND